MKEDSLKFQQLIKDLYTPPRSWKTFLHKGKQLEETLTELGNSRELDAVVHLARFLFDPSLKIALAAARAVATILSTLQPVQFVRLDQILRGNVYSSAYRLELKDIASVQRFGELGWVPLVVASCNFGGFVREASIKQLPQWDETLVLPFLLMRANDWVPQVRDAASAAFQRKLTPENAEAIVSTYYLASRLAVGRAQARHSIVESVDELLCREECHSALMKGLRSPDPFTRRSCFQLVLKTRREPAPVPLLEVARMALESSDALVRMSTLRRLIECEVIPANEELLKDFLIDSFMKVRKAAFDSLKSLSPEAAEHYVFRLLTDRSATIRSMSRIALTKSDPGKDRRFFSEHYELLLTAESIRELVGAVSGFAETALPGEEVKLIPLLQHPSARVRAAVVHGLAQLNANTHRDVFLNLLMNGSPVLSRISRFALAKIQPSLTSDELWNLFQSSERHAPTVNLLWLMDQTSKWERIQLFLRAVAHHNLTTRTQALAYLESWMSRFNRNFGQPSAPQLSDAQQAFQSVKSRLDPHFAMRLSFYLKG